MIDEDGPQDEVDLALADLAIAAVHRLHTEMNTARNSKDRIAAANSILDRVGYSRTPRAQADVADKEIRSALKAALRRGVSPEVMQELDDMSHEEKMRRIELAQEEAEQRQQEARELGPDDEETDKWLHAWTAEELGGLLENLTPEQRDEFVRRLPPSAADRAKELLADYATLQHQDGSVITLLPHQQLPEPHEIQDGHLFAGGRGAGKTLALANYVARIAEKVPGLRARVISPTLSDAVNGVALDPYSGILAQSPTAQFKAHGVEGARVIWPNGSICYLVGTPTFKDVDRLRALTNCVAAETRVLMADGSTKRADEVRVDDWVQTRQGARRVQATKITEPRRLLQLITESGRILRTTADHRIAVNDDALWVNMESLDQDREVVTWERGSSSDTASAGTPEGTDTTATIEADCCIERCTPVKSDHCRADALTTSTTSTGTSPTTSPATSRPSRSLSMWRSMVTFCSSLMRSGRKPGPCAKCGTPSRRSERSASSAAPSSSTGMRRLIEFASARTAAIAHTATPSGRATSSAMPSAPSAALRSAPGGMRPSTPGGVPAVDRVQSVLVTDRVEPTVDISVEGCPEFIANGIVVHNCDLDAYDEAAANPRITEAVQQANLSRRGQALHHPIWVAATTPRPVPQYKKWLQDPRVTVTHARTIDNPHTPDAYREYAESLQGTALYRQEILGEVLEDTPGALWTHADVTASEIADEAERVKIIQAIEKTVVGVDPPSGHGTCGIVVAGLTTAEKDPSGYPRLVILDDYSVSEATPGQWGAAVLDAHVAYGAHIVAERNQGGLMVESTIRAAAEHRGMPLVPVTLATASVSKERRAAPMALPWEVRPQRAVIAPPDGDMRRVALLVDQMTSWIPGTFSPDRLDAAAWAAAYLAAGGAAPAAQLQRPGASSLQRPGRRGGPDFRRALMGRRR